VVRPVFVCAVRSLVSAFTVVGYAGWGED